MVSLLCQVECVIICSWLDLDRFVAGVRASNVGALAEDLDKSVDGAFPAVALADNGLVIVSDQSGHLSKSLTMLQILILSWLKLIEPLFQMRPN